MQLSLTAVLALGLAALAFDNSVPDGLPQNARIVQTVNVTRAIAAKELVKRGKKFHETAKGTKWCGAFTGKRASYCYGPDKCEATINQGYSSTETKTAGIGISWGPVSAGISYTKSKTNSVGTTDKHSSRAGECCTWAMRPEVGFVCGCKTSKPKKGCTDPKKIGCLNRPTGNEMWNYWCWKAKNDEECAKSYVQQADSACLKVDVKY